MKGDRGQYKRNPYNKKPKPEKEPDPVYSCEKLNKMLYGLRVRGMGYVIEHVSIADINEMILASNDGDLNFILRELKGKIGSIRKLDDLLARIPFNMEAYIQTLPTLDAE